MKVSELRELLNKLDGELEVVTEAIIQEECGYVDVIGTGDIMLLDDQGKGNRAIVIKTRRYYKNESITSALNSNSTIKIGNAGISSGLKDKGYACTLCMLVEDRFIDIHVTKKQLEYLKESVEHWLDEGE